MPGVTAITRAARRCRNHDSPSRAQVTGPGRSSPRATAARGQSSRQSSTSGARWRRAASHAVIPRKSGGVLAITRSGRGPESATGRADQAKVRWFQSLVTAVFRGVAWSQTRSTVMPPRRSVARRTLAYSGRIAPEGWFGSPVSTRTSWPARSSARAKCAARAGAAPDSGGKYWVTNRTRIGMRARLSRAGPGSGLAKHSRPESPP